MSDDTIHLLKECDSGCKTAVNSIKEVLDNIQSTELLKILTDSVKEHEKIGNEIHETLSALGSSGKDPDIMARAMSWLKINAKILNEPSDKTIASLMTDGCNMGIKQLSTYQNKYPTADKKSQKLAKKIILEEEYLLDKLKEFL